MEDKKKVSVMSQVIFSDEEFKKILEDTVELQRSYIESDNRKGLPADLHVFSKHGIHDEPHDTIIFMEGFPPPIGAIISRYDLLRIVGAKYYEEEIKKKPSGEKKYPLAVFLNSEAWMRMESNKEEIEKIKHRKEPLPSMENRPDKQEVIITAGMTLDKRNAFAISKISRTKDHYIMLHQTTFQHYDPTGKQRSESDLLTAFYQGFMRAFYEDQIQK